MLSHGADINIKDIEDWTVLHYSCYNGQKDITQYVLSFNNNSNDNNGNNNGNDGNNNNQRIDIGVRDNYLKKTALEFAKYRQFGEIVQLFGGKRRRERVDNDRLDRLDEMFELLE